MMPRIAINDTYGSEKFEVRGKEIYLINKYCKQNIKYYIQNTKYKIQNTNVREIANTEHTSISILDSRIVL